MPADQAKDPAVESVMGPDSTAPTRDTAFQRLLKDTLLYAPARVLPLATNFVLLIVAARVMSAEQVGTYGIISTTVVLAAALIGSWLDQAGIRFLSTNPREDAVAALLRQHFAVVLALLGAVLLIGAAGTAALAFTKASVSIWVVSTAFLAVLLLYNASQSVTVARFRSRAYIVSETLRAVLTLASSVLLVFYWKRSFLGLLIGSIIGTLVPLLYAGLASGLFRRPSTAKAAWRYGTQAAWYGFPLIGWFLGSQLLALSDRYSIQYFRGPADVGVYHANYQLVSGAFNLAFLPLLLAAHPILMSMADSKNAQSAESLVRSFSQIFIRLAVPLLILAIIAFPAAAAYVLGGEFRRGAVIIPWIAIGSVGWSLGMYGHKRFELVDKTWIMLIAVLTCAIANLLLNALLVPGFGILGASVATCISYWLYPLLIWLFPGSAMRWRVPWRTLVVCALAVPLGVAVAFALPPFGSASYTIFERAAVGTLVGGIILFGAREVSAHTIARSVIRLFR